MIIHPSQPSRLTSICQGGGQETVRKQTPPSKELIKATSPDSLLTVAKAGIFQRYCFQKINKDVQEAEVLGDLFNYSPQSCPSNLLTFRPDLANPQQILIYQLKQGPLFYWFTELRKIRHSSEKNNAQNWGGMAPFDITFCCTHVLGESTKWKSRSFATAAEWHFRCLQLAFVQPAGIGPKTTVARD